MLGEHRLMYLLDFVQSFDECAFRNYYNLYIGWGQKYEQFNPSQPPLPEMEYAHEFLEIDDPSVELEKAREEAQRAYVAEFTSDEEEQEDYEETLTDEDN